MAHNCVSSAFLEAASADDKSRRNRCVVIVENEAQFHRSLIAHASNERKVC